MAMRLKLKLSRLITRMVATGLIVSTLSAGVSLYARADSADMLPDMGTTAGGTLTIDQELQMGDYYVRQLRGSAPLINDPLIDEYVNQLGDRLVSHAYSVRFPFHFLSSTMTSLMLSPFLAVMSCCTRRFSVLPITRAS